MESRICELGYPGPDVLLNFFTVSQQVYSPLYSQFLHFTRFSPFLTLLQPLVAVHYIALPSPVTLGSQLTLSFQLTEGAN
jgi:hypothetical protein